jgi:hypothetical protein
VREEALTTLAFTHYGPANLARGDLFRGSAGPMAIYDGRRLRYLPISLLSEQGDIPVTILLNEFPASDYFREALEGSAFLSLQDYAVTSFTVQPLRDSSYTAFVGRAEIHHEQQGSYSLAYVTEDEENARDVTIETILQAYAENSVERKMGISAPPFVSGRISNGSTDDPRYPAGGNNLYIVPKFYL